MYSVLLWHYIMTLVYCWHIYIYHPDNAESSTDEMDSVESLSLRVCSCW